MSCKNYVSVHCPLTNREQLQTQGNIVCNELLDSTTSSLCVIRIQETRNASPMIRS